MSIKKYAKQMSMQLFNKLIYLIVFSLVLFSCKKKIIEETVYDNIIYEVNDVAVYGSNVEKTKQKSTNQYISILYTDLFNQAISNNELAEISELTLAMGDKQTSNELIISHYLNSPLVNIPTNSQMRADIPTFINETYVKFYQRYPTEYEKIYLKKMIEDDPLITTENIYVAFALSNEYYFY